MIKTLSNSKLMFLKSYSLLDIIFFSVNLIKNYVRNIIKRNKFYLEDGYTPLLQKKAGRDWNECVIIVGTYCTRGHRWYIVARDFVIPGS